MKYQILASNTTAELSHKVNESLKNGWTCQGGVTICYTDDSVNPIICAQAMIKIEYK